MKTFNTKNTRWVIDGDKILITSFFANAQRGQVEMKLSDMSSAVKQFFKLIEEKRDA